MTLPYVWNAGVQARDAAGSECCANGYEDSELICAIHCGTAGRAIVLGPLHETSVYYRLQISASARARVGGLMGEIEAVTSHGHLAFVTDTINKIGCKGQSRKKSHLDSGRSQVSNVL